MQHTFAKSPNDVWTWDFIHNRSTDGRALKFQAILDEYTQKWTPLFGYVIVFLKCIRFGVIPILLLRR